MKLGIIATQIADDGGGPSVFFDDLRAAPASRPDAEKYGRVSGTFVRTTPAAPRAPRATTAKTPRRRA